MYLIGGFKHDSLFFHDIWDVIPTPLTNSIIFQGGRSTTNQFSMRPTRSNRILILTVSSRLKARVNTAMDPWVWMNSVRSSFSLGGLRGSLSGWMEGASRSYGYSYVFIFPIKNGSFRLIFLIWTWTWKGFFSCFWSWQPGSHWELRVKVYAQSGPPQWCLLVYKPQ